MFQGGVCNWAEPGRVELERYGKPTPEAVAVRVKIVPVKP
jgi:hypothetical protein